MIKWLIVFMSIIGAIGFVGFVITSVQLFRSM